MEGFLRAIPAAASSDYALAAYAICAILFLIAGARLVMAKTISNKVMAVPENERRRVLEIAADTVLPIDISAEQWIRLKQLKWTFALLGSVLIAVFTVTIVALVHPEKARKEARRFGNR